MKFTDGSSARAVGCPVLRPKELPSLDSGCLREEGSYLLQDAGSTALRSQGLQRPKAVAVRRETPGISCPLQQRAAEDSRGPASLPAAEKGSTQVKLQTPASAAAAI